MAEKPISSRKGMCFDNLENHALSRALAISAGDLSVVVRKEVKKVLAENRNNVLKALYAGLDELLRRDLIFADECESLKRLCKHLVQATRGKEDGEDAYLAIRAIYHEMLTSQDSAPAALAIASVATSAFNIEKSSPVTITPETTGAGAGVGAVIGGVIGGIVGGFVGAGIGAAIGGAAGAAIGWCNETGNGVE